MNTLAAFLSEQKLDAEIIVVNDGGRDEGAEKVREQIHARPWIQLIDRKINRGKGFSIREGLRAAKGDFIVYTDADLPYLTAPIADMLGRLKRNETDLILANRELSPDGTQKKPHVLRQITHIIYSRFVRTLIPIPFSDTLAGLKAMNRKTARMILPKLTIDRFSFDVELILIAQKAGCRIQEIPVSLKNVGTSNLSIRRDAPEMVREVIQIFLQNRKGFYAPKEKRRGATA